MTTKKPTAAPAEPTPYFQNVSAEQKDCIVLIYDLENFTGFLSRVPDIHRDVANYLNFIDAQIRKVFTGGPVLVGSEKGRTHHPLDLDVIHEKFLGDGGMFIAQVPEATKLTNHIALLCNRCWNLKRNFSALNDLARKFMPVYDLPERIRFGITYGQTLELTRKDGQKEYVGFAINLAARLQKYAGTASFLASARLPKADDLLPKSDFVKVRAKALRGRSGELVFIDRNDLQKAKSTKGEQDVFEEL